MNQPFESAVAIDTNIFLHLFHRGNDADAVNVNADSHIDNLLDAMQAASVVPILDSQNKIGSEYLAYLHSIMKEEDEMDTKRLILKYWIIDADPAVVQFDTNSELYKRIKKVIHERDEAVDRAFVFVAFSRGTVLITNDRRHILFGPNGERNTSTYNRRTRLMKETKKSRTKGGEILSSMEAHERM